MHKHILMKKLGFILVMRYHVIDHGLVNLAISRCPKIGWYRAWMHVSRIRCLPVQTEHRKSETLWTGDNYLRGSHLKGPDILPVAW